MIDVNVYLSRWPFRRLPLDETETLVARMKELGVTQAWAGSFDGVFHKDVGSANARLADACRQFKETLIPFGTVNPALPDWREDLRRCAEDLKMPGIRLHPNYHGYSLDAPAFAELLDLAAEHKLIVQLALRMEDDRTQHHLARVADVDASPLAALVKARPGLPLVLLNAMRTLRTEDAEKLASAGEVYFDVAMLEGVGGIERLLKTIPAERILFGTYAPFFYPESALLKLKESELGGAQREAISVASAERLLRSSANAGERGA